MAKQNSLLTSGGYLVEFIFNFRYGYNGLTFWARFAAQTRSRIKNRRMGGIPWGESCEQPLFPGGVRGCSNFLEGKADTVKDIGHGFPIKTR